MVDEPQKMEIPLPHLFLLFSYWQRHCPLLYHWVLTIRGNAIVPTLQTRNSERLREENALLSRAMWLHIWVTCPLFCSFTENKCLLSVQSMLAAGNASDNGEYTSLRCCLVSVLIGLQCLNCTPPNSCLFSPHRHLHSALHTQCVPNKYLLHWAAWAYPQRPLRPLDCNNWH